MGTALLAIVPLCLVFIPQPQAAKEISGTTDGKPSVLNDLREGLRFIWGWPGLVMIIAISALVYMLMVPAYSLLPILVTEHLSGGALQLAWFNIATAVGTIVSGLAMSVWGGFRRRIVTMLLAMALCGVSWVVLGVAPANGLLLAIGAQFFSAVMNSVGVASIIAILQAKDKNVVPPELQGRVFSLDLALVTAAAPIGLAVAGPLSDVVGVRSWFVIGGLVTTVMNVGAFFVPTIIQIEDEAGLGDKAAENHAHGHAP